MREEGARGPRTMNPEMPDDVEIGYLSSRMLPLVVLATTMTVLSASTAFCFGDDGIDRHHALIGFAGLAVFGIATCRRPSAEKDLDTLFGAGAADHAAARPTDAARAQNGGAWSYWMARCAHHKLSSDSEAGRFRGHGSMSSEMLRPGYITEKSERRAPFRSRIGQTACS